MLAVLYGGMARGQDLYNGGDTLCIGKGSTLFVGSNIRNTGNAVLINNGSLNTTGNLNNSQISIYSGTGLFEMSGAGSQSFSGARYYNIKVSGAGTKTMNGPTYLKSSLIFTNGNINTALTKDTIFMDSAASLTELSGSEVLGFVKYTKYLAKGQPYTFGNIGLSFEALGATPGKTVIIRGTGDSATQKGMTKQGAEQGTKRYFDIHPAVDAALNASITFYYQDDELNNIQKSDLALFRSTDNGVNWTYMGYATRNTTLNTLSLNGVNTFSRWTTGSMTAPLPVELMSFEATHVGSDALLQWATASEKNNNFFSIERSSEGQRWTDIGKVDGNGTTAEIHNYEYRDLNINLLFSQSLYYRLKQVDYNGNFQYSEVKEITLSGIEATGIKAWYNGTEDRVYLNYTTATAESFSVQLTDIQGKLIAAQRVDASEGVTQISMNMIGLDKGVYVMSVNNSRGTQSKKIIKN